MEVTEKRALGKTVQKTRFVHIRSQDIRWHCYGQEIGEWIMRRDECNKLVLRMAPEITLELVWDNSPSGRRSSGQLHKWWSDSHSGKYQVSSLTSRRGGGGGAKKKENFKSWDLFSLTVLRKHDVQVHPVELSLGNFFQKTAQEFKFSCLAV